MNAAIKGNSKRSYLLDHFMCVCVGGCGCVYTSFTSRPHKKNVSGWIGSGDFCIQINMQKCEKEGGEQCDFFSRLYSFLDHLFQFHKKKKRKDTSLGGIHRKHHR